MPNRRLQWAILRSLRKAWERFAEGWKSTPAEARRNWAIAVAIGFAAAAAMTTGLLAAGMGLHVTLQSGRSFRTLSLITGYLGMKVFILGPWMVWARARPNLVAEGIASPGFHALPSGHAISAVVILGLLTAWWMDATQKRFERLVVAVLFVAVIAAVNLARLRLGSHWPSDAIAGTVIGAVWLAALLVALRQVEGGGGRGINSQSD